MTRSHGGIDNARNIPSPRVAERRLMHRYGSATPKEVLELGTLQPPQDRVGYTGFIVASGRLTGDIDDQHAEVIGRIVFQLPETDGYAWKDVHRAGLIRVTAIRDVGVQMYGPPSEMQLRTIRELMSRARRAGVAFHWDGPPGAPSGTRSIGGLRGSSVPRPLGSRQRGRRARRGSAEASLPA